MLAHLRYKFVPLILVSLTTVVVLIGADFLFPVQGEVEFSRLILDNKGEIVHAYMTSDDKWRMKTELSEISPTLKKAIIQKEDKYFYCHPGINH